MQQQETKLTSVKFLKDLYKDFKRIAIDDELTIQLLGNISMNAYVHNPKFRQLILSASNCFDGSAVGFITRKDNTN
jgi:hypothetical protein